MQNDAENASLGGFDKFRSSLNRGLLGLASACLVVALATMMMEALSRLFFNVSFFWAEELVRFAIIAVAFLCIPLAGSSGRHIRAGLFVGLLGRRLRLFLAGVTVLCSLAYCLVLGWSGWLQTSHLWFTRMRSESTLELPMWTITALVPLGAFFLFFYYLGRLRAVIGGNDEPYGKDAHMEGPQ